MHALISLAIRAHQLPTACWDHVGRGEDKADSSWLYRLSSFTGRWPIPYSQVQNHDLGLSTPLWCYCNDLGIWFSVLWGLVETTMTHTFSSILL